MLALVLIAAGVVHTSVHVLLEQTAVAVGFRSAFSNIQRARVAAMTVVAAVIAA